LQGAIKLFGRRKLITAGAVATAMAGALGVAGSVPASAAGGWSVTSITGAGTNVALNGVFERASTDAWAVGQQFGAGGAASPPPVTYHWAGSAWTPVPVPALPAYGALVGVSASSASDAWAVGFLVFPGRWNNRRALLMHWNGSAWSLDTTSAVSQSRVTLTGVADLGAASAWAIAAGGGSNGLAHWDGTAWNFVTLPDSSFSPGAGQAISASSASDVWVVGTGINATTLASFPEAMHFDGTAWHAIALPAPAATSVISAVTAISPANAWAVGQQIGQATPVGGGTLIEHWDGAKWSVVPSPSPGFEPSLTGIAARSASDVVAAGSALPSANGGPSQDVILRFNGTSWSDDTGGAALPGTLPAAAAAPGATPELAVGNSSGSTAQIVSHP
jgi:hypothetical protein